MAFRVTVTGASGQTAAVDTSKYYFNEGARSAPGVLLVSRENLLKVGGLNSDLTGWGWEDTDLLVRLQLKCNLRHHQIGRGTHISHADERRELAGYGSPVESQGRNSAVCIARYRAGIFDGTLDRDLQDWRCRIDAWSLH